MPSCSHTIATLRRHTLRCGAEETEANRKFWNYDWDEGSPSTAIVTRDTMGFKAFEGTRAREASRLKGQAAVTLELGGEDAGHTSQWRGAVQERGETTFGDLMKEAEQEEKHLTDMERTETRQCTMKESRPIFFEPWRGVRWHRSENAKEGGDERNTMEMWRNAPRQLKLHVAHMVDCIFAGEGARKGALIRLLLFRARDVATERLGVTARERAEAA